LKAFWLDLAIQNDCRRICGRSIKPILEYCLAYTGCPNLDLVQFENDLSLLALHQPDMSTFPAAPLDLCTPYIPLGALRDLWTLLTDLHPPLLSSTAHPTHWTHHGQFISNSVVADFPILVAHLPGSLVASTCCQTPVLSFMAWFVDDCPPGRVNGS
jgi:hypothetical protein